MHDIFDDEPKPAAPAEDASQGEPQVDGAPQQDAQDAGEPAPPAGTDTEKQVPLAALEAERATRKDWKEKYLRLEGEVKALKERQYQPQGYQQPQQPQEPLSAEQEVQQRIQTMVLNTSQALAEKTYGKDVVSEAYAKFVEAEQRDPTLRARALQQIDPWDFVVKESRRLQLLDELGDDPVSYREKLKAELMAELNQSKTPTQQIPQSLAGTRSTAVRSSNSFTGPPPFSSLFRN